jgi:hypothetical protein
MVVSSCDRIGLFGFFECGFSCLEISISLLVLRGSLFKITFSFLPLFESFFPFLTGCLGGFIDSFPLS